MTKEDVELKVEQLRHEIAVKRRSSKGSRTRKIACRQTIWVCDLAVSAVTWHHSTCQFKEPRRVYQSSNQN